MSPNMSAEMSAFALEVMNHKYSHTKKDGTKESWKEIAQRVTKNVMHAVDAPRSLVDAVQRTIEQRQFMPGGRYLYAAGRPYHQTQNCLLLRATDSREGWAELMHNASMALMTGAGIGVDYTEIRAEGKPVRKTGGFATGPLALMQMVNEAGRGIMQGGSRRSAIWAGLNWKHPDIHKFIQAKNWIPEVRDLKLKDFNFPATLDGTNISVQLDDAFFAAYNDEKNPLHAHAQSVYWAVIERMLKTGEPGFSVDGGKNNKETLRNAPVSADTWIMTDLGYRQVGEMVDFPCVVWTGKQWAPTTFTRTAQSVPTMRVMMTGGRSIVADPSHEFLVERYTGKGKHRRLNVIDRVPARELRPGDQLHVSNPLPSVDRALDADSYILGYTYGDGSFCKRYDNRAEITFCTDESKSCAAPLRGHSWVVSITESDARGYTRAYLKNDIFRGRSKMICPNDIPVEKIGSFVAGLFDSDGSYDSLQHRFRLASKHREFLEGVRRLLERIGIVSGVIRSSKSRSGFGAEPGWMLIVTAEYVSRFVESVPTIRLQGKTHTAYRKTAIKVLSVTPDDIQDVYCCNVGVEEHSFVAEGVVISNCTEVCSADDSDICNLGSINLARIETLDEFKSVMDCAVAFLLAGTVYSDVPYSKVDMIRTKNRRLGLGLMGVHEWLLLRGKLYGKDPELESYLEAYATSNEIAKKYADEWEISVPIKTRAIAPTGTIGIVAETTTGIEPIFCAAYKRRYLKGSTWNWQYVLDPTAKRLVEHGGDPEKIEDAYVLSGSFEDVERRLAFQAWIQQYVDHGISSTINLPAWGSEVNNAGRMQEFGHRLMKHLPKLRGITCYPDGARGGQPITAVSYRAAAKHVGEIFVESTDVCDLTRGGSCGA
jgi:ribonucleotide reductase alpha subunit